MKKISKSIITLLIILSILSPAIYFLIYPQYSDLKIKFEQINIERISKDITLGFLTTISPYKTSYEKVLGAQTIEESLQKENIVLEKKILEELNMEIIIKSLNIKGNIFQGKDSQTMNLGFWHYPISQYPGEKGNSVIIGHRFQNIPPKTDTFYNLDKVKIGDEIIVQHKEGEYKYIVIDSQVIDPNDLSVLGKTDDYRLTLITCTPLWTSEKRLVITAKLDKLYKKV